MRSRVAGFTILLGVAALLSQCTTDRAGHAEAAAPPAPNPPAPPAGPATLFGRVLTAEGDEPVSGARVETRDGTQRSATTGPDGSFRLVGLAPGMTEFRIHSGCGWRFCWRIGGRLTTRSAVSASSVTRSVSLQPSEQDRMIRRAWSSDISPFSYAVTTSL